MANDYTPKVKPYPQPIQDKAGSVSAFSRFDEQGRHFYAILAPECPVSSFENTEGKWGFVRKKGADGKELTKTHKRIAPYLPSDSLKELVRLAQILQRPVLIKGEPGSGKTQLAKSVAFEWYREAYREHYFEWHIKSNSKAADGLYAYDHIKRLRDANDTSMDKSVLDDKKRYRTFGPMGMAFLTSTRDNPSILLIDEIDKADIDFPNDLLLELDERRFRIPDTSEEYEAEYPPVVFITSNDERELPEAFLRRCLFMYIKFPEDSDLKNIIEAHLPDLMKQQHAFEAAASEAAIEAIKKTDPDYENKKADAAYHEEMKQKQLKNFVDFAILRFKNLRKSIDKNPADNKRVSTSELLDWLRAYEFDLQNAQSKAKDKAEVSEKFAAWAKQFQKDQKGGISTELLNEGLLGLPFYYQALLKTYAAAINEGKLEKPK
jgi:MoxR-like ATPase